MRSYGFTQEPPAEPQELSETVRRIVDYWNQLSFCDDAGGTSWDVLDDIRCDVTELLSSGLSDDIRRAERLTAKAEYFRQFGPD